jgi:hypothetical protein
MKTENKIQFLEIKPPYGESIFNSLRSHGNLSTDFLCCSAYREPSNQMKKPLKRPRRIKQQRTGKLPSKKQVE